MSKNITIQGFNSLFNCAMEDVLQDVSDIPLTWLFLGLIIFLMFDCLLRIMQVLAIPSHLPSQLPSSRGTDF